MFFSGAFITEEEDKVRYFIPDWGNKLATAAAINNSNNLKPIYVQQEQTASYSCASANGSSLSAY